MKELNRQSLSELLTVDKFPSLSLYMPTHRKYPENAQDIIRYKQLLKKLEELLPSDYQKDQVEEIMRSFELLIDDKLFWDHTSDGLAIFSSTGVFEVFNMDETVGELAIVKTGFHLRPLRQYLQSSKRYFVLALSLDEIQLFEGNRQVIWQVDLPENISSTIEQALGDKLTEKHSTVASYGGSAGQSSPMHHGQGGKKDEAGKDAERFFRVVSKEIDKYLTNFSSIPIILAALPEHHHLYRKINSNTALLDLGIDQNPKSMGHKKLAEYACAILEKDMVKFYQELSEKYDQAKADSLGSDEINEILKASDVGRVVTLIVLDNTIRSTAIANNSDEAEVVAGNHNHVDDEMLDSISENVLKMGGDILVIPQAYMPGKTGCAAIFRY